jgi:hypothetical protein
VKNSARAARVLVSRDRRGLVSQAGAVLLWETMRVTGLGRGLSESLAGAGAPGSDGELVTVDLDATIVITHSDKERAAPTWKKTFGFHPLTAWADHGEITRTRIRVWTAMAAQPLEQGRYPGGRPPFGYRLGDAGPHPNKAHAAWGQRAHKLEPDLETAPVVTWIFAQRLAGQSAARITRALNDAGVPCPSAADPGRNLHRTGAAWALRTVAAILGNPRYPGRQVWIRQRTDFDLVDPVNTALGLGRCSGGTCPRAGSSPGSPRTRRWSARPTSSSPGHVRAARPGRPGGTPVPAGRASGLRAVRSAAGVSVVQREARLQVPPQPHQRQQPGPRPAEDHVRARGPGLASSPGPRGAARARRRGGRRSRCAAAAAGCPAPGRCPWWRRPG